MKEQISKIIGDKVAEMKGRSLINFSSITEMIDEESIIEMIEENSEVMNLINSMSKF